MYALDAQTGCVRWVYQANGPVRMPIRAVQYRSSYRLVFGDQTGWFYCLNAADGHVLWSKRIDDHDAARLTGAAVDYNGTVFVPVASWEETRASGAEYECCTFRGSVVALRVEDGWVVWKTWTVEASRRLEARPPEPRGGGPSGAGICSPQHSIFGAGFSM